MWKTIEPTGLAAGSATQLQQFRIAEVGTVARGHSTMSAVLAEGLLAESGSGIGGSVEGWEGREFSRAFSAAERMLLGNGSGLPACHELAPAHGERLMEHIEPAPRHGAPGARPRKIPA